MGYKICAGCSKRKIWWGLSYCDSGMHMEFLELLAGFCYDCCKVCAKCDHRVICKFCKSKVCGHYNPEILKLTPKSNFEDIIINI